MCQSFALAFREAGYRVGIVFGRLLDPDRLPVSSTRMMEELRRHGVETWFEPGFAKLWSPDLVRRLVARARSQEADAFIAFNQRDRKYAVWAARKAGLPCVISVQNQHAFHGRGLVKRLKQEIYARVIRKARLLICTSQVVQREVTGRFGVPAGQTVVLPNGIEVGRFSPADRTKPRRWAELGVKPEQIVAANLGRIDPQKGQDLLVEAFARVASRFPQLCLGLIGSDSQTGAEYSRKLRAQVQELGLSERVLFSGWRDDVPELLAESDVYAHSARWEGLSLAVLEAMASHLPVMYPDCSGRLEGFVDGEHGWMVETGNVAQLADGLAHLASLDAEARRTMGARVRGLVEQHYDVSRVIAPRFVELVAEAIYR